MIAMKGLNNFEVKEVSVEFGETFVVLRYFFSLFFGTGEEVE